MTNQFEALGLENAIVEALNKKGYVTPTPIQEKVIPILLNGGLNVIGQAQTGTGKTAAFGLPVLQNIQENTGEVQSLILAPTRELAIQVAEEIRSFKGSKKINIATVYGGQSIDKQIQELRRGSEIVVGTPGRVIDLMKRKKLDISNIKYFILDEADEMLNMGFIEDIEWIIAQSNDQKQVLLFSATMPKKILKLAKKYMGNYEVLAVEKTELTTENTEQVYYSCFARDKMNIIRRILQAEADFYGIIFTNTKMNADDVTRQLTSLGFKAEALHGDIAQNQRERILKRFKDEKCKILVATDVAARGIDVNDLTHVINYSLPQDPEAYVHRIGRTGRAGKKGKAISLVEKGEYRHLMLIQNNAKTDISFNNLRDITQSPISSLRSDDTKPFMSFVVVNLNSGTDLEDTINNLISQKCRLFEIIIKDGSSTDGSADFLKELDEPRIKFVVSEDSGIYDAMNQAIAHCKGDFVWFVNAGDLLSNTNTLNLVYEQVLEAKSVKSSKLLYGDCYFEEHGYVRFSPKRITGFFIFHTHINHQAQIWARSVFSERGFDLSYKCCADYEFFVCSLIKHGLSGEKVVGLEIKYAGGGFSETKSAKDLIKKERAKIKSDYFSNIEMIYYSFLSLVITLLKTCINQSSICHSLFMRYNPYKRKR